jgi:hypothetical protein
VQLAGQVKSMKLSDRRQRHFHSATRALASSRRII